MVGIFQNIFQMPGNLNVGEQTNQTSLDFWRSYQHKIVNIKTTLAQKIESRTNINRSFVFGRIVEVKKTRLILEDVLPNLIIILSD